MQSKGGYEEGTGQSPSDIRTPDGIDLSMRESSVRYSGHDQVEINNHAQSPQQSNITIKDDDGP